MRKRLLLSFLVASILASPELFAKSKAAISFKGGYYFPVSSTFNNEVIPPINNSFNEIASSLESMGSSANFIGLDKIKGEPIYGGEIEIFLMPQISFSLGAEYWSYSSSASANASLNSSEFSFNLEAKYNYKQISIIPIIGTLRYSFYLGRLRFYGGIGAGYYFGKVNNEWHFSFSLDETDIYEENWEQESVGNSIVPSINGGLDFDFMKNISIAVDLRYILGSIKSFKIKKDSLDPTTEGEELQFFDIHGNEKSFKLELSGLDIGIYLKIKF